MEFTGQDCLRCGSSDIKLDVLHRVVVVIATIVMVIYRNMKAACIDRVTIESLRDIVVVDFSWGHICAVSRTKGSDPLSS